MFTKLYQQADILYTSALVLLFQIPMHLAPSHDLDWYNHKHIFEIKMKQNNKTINTQKTV